MDNRLVLVVGHGRSGTSLFTTILKTLGGHVPQPEVEPDETNPRGFGEPRWLVDFHTALLKRANVHPADARPIAWSRTETTGSKPKVEAELTAWLEPELQTGRDVVIKDPRSLWFLPLWSTVATELKSELRYATMLRAPQEVLRSRAAAYGGSRPQTSIAMAWINSMLHTEAATRGAPRSFTRFDDLLGNWEDVVAGVCDALDLDLLRAASSDQVQQVRELVDPSLRRSSGGWEGIGVAPDVARLADETWERLEALATKGESPDLTAALDELTERYAAVYAAAEEVAESSISAARRAGVRSGRAEAEKAVAASDGEPAEAGKKAAGLLRRRR